MLTHVLASVAARQPVDERERDEHRALRCARSPGSSGPFDEDADPVHITASALVVGRRGIVLLVHRRLGIWLQPGGHVDPGETPWEAARRETVEETGIDVRFVDAGGRRTAAAGPRRRARRRPRPHPPRPALPVRRRHADPSPPPDESQDVRWFAWDEALAVADAGLAGILPELAGHAGR